MSGWRPGTGRRAPAGQEPAGRGQGPTSTRRAMTRFALASLVVAVALGVAGALVIRRAAVTAATGNARS